MVLALLLIMAAVLRVGAAVVARHQAQSAADLAALAAAAALPAGREAACGRARELGTAMRAEVVGCDVDGLDITVRTTVRVVIGAASAAARAGPVRAGGANPPG